MQSAAELDLTFERNARELRETWQARALIETQHEALGAVVLSIIAQSYDENGALEILLRVAFPGFKSIKAPYLCSAGKIAKTGNIIADVDFGNGGVRKNMVFFRDTAHMRDVLRKLADRLHLSDADREQMFLAARKWVVCDYRLDPTMNPNDPDAKRLVVH